MLRLRDDQWDRIREHFPEEPVDSEHQGAVAPAAAVLSQLQTVQRRFQQWCEREMLRDILTQLANTLCEEGAIDERESFIDATFASAKGGR